MTYFSERSYRQPSLPGGSVRRSLSSRGRRALVCALGSAGLLLINTQVPIIQHVRQLCIRNMVAIQPEDYSGFWEVRREQEEGELPEVGFDTLVGASQPKSAPLTTGEAPEDPTVGFAVTLTSCPEDMVACHNDPGHAFYEAAAILKHHICRLHKGGEKGAYDNCDFYAIVHPNAQYCLGPNGDSYDRVRILEGLGYSIKIWGGQIAESDIKDPTLRAELEAGPGVDDFMIFNLWRLLNQHIIVLIDDFSTQMLKRPDELYDHFLANDNVKVMYTREYATSYPTKKNQRINPGFMLIKPDENTVAMLDSIVMNSSYEVATGWDGSGVGDFECAASATGAITYTYVSQFPDVAEEMDRCLYGNTVEAPRNPAFNSVCKDGQESCPDCRDLPLSEIVVGTPRASCGEPWNCYYDDSWDPATKTLCEGFHREWFEQRLDFEEKNYEVQAKRDGDFYPDVFLGYCSEASYKGYTLMLPDEDICKTAMTVTSMTETKPDGVDHSQMLELTTGKYTGNGALCVWGKVSYAIRAVEGTPEAFTIKVNGVDQPGVDVSLLKPNEYGELVFEDIIIHGLNKAYGTESVVEAIVTMKEPEYTLRTRTLVTGTVPNYISLEA